MGLIKNGQRITRHIKHWEFGACVGHSVHVPAFISVDSNALRKSQRLHMAKRQPVQKLR